LLVTAQSGAVVGFGQEATGGKDEESSDLGDGGLRVRN
jgi:hypothetical protein